MCIYFIKLFQVMHLCIICVNSCITMDYTAIEKHVYFFLDIENKIKFDDINDYFVKLHQLSRI